MVLYLSLSLSHTHFFFSFFFFSLGLSLVFFYWFGRVNAGQFCSLFSFRTYKCTSQGFRNFNGWKLVRVLVSAHSWSSPKFYNFFLVCFCGCFVFWKGATLFHSTRHVENGQQLQSVLDDPSLEESVSRPLLLEQVRKTINSISHFPIFTINWNWHEWLNLQSGVIVELVLSLKSWTGFFKTGALLLCNRRCKQSQQSMGGWDSLLGWYPKWKPYLLSASCSVPLVVICI